MDDVVVTKPMIGICHMQACVKKGLGEDKILEEANKLNLCGTTQGWCRIEREGNMAPVQCVDHPDREHVIIVC